MGGGGGFNPISLISSVVFGSVLGPMGRQAARAGGGDAQAQDAEAERQAAEARRRADRKKEEATLLAKARQAERASQAAQSAPSAQESLGAAAPQVVASQLKARLGQ